MKTAERSCYQQVPTDYLRQLLCLILEEEGLNPNTANCEVNSVLAGLWASSIFHVRARDASKTISLYLKCLPLNKFKREILDAHLHFKNEVMFYNKVYSAYMELQREKLPQEPRPPIPIPKCYRAEEDGKNDVIVMEDLTERGFILLSRLQVLGLPELHLVIRDLGRFHAFSLAMKDQNPQRFAELRECVSETLFQPPGFDNMTRDVIANSLKSTLILMKEHYPEDSPYLIKFESFAKDAVDQLPVLCCGDPANEPYNVITHGDIWSNNLMFHYPTESPNNEPDEMRFLDFQQVRYASPANEIGRFLFTSADRQTRDAHRNDLLRSYHNSLSETLRQLGSEPEQLFPFSALEPQLRKFATFYISISLISLPRALDESEGSDEDITGDDIDVIKAAIEDSLQTMTDQCRRRVFEVIEESVDRGYIL